MSRDHSQLRRLIIAANMFTPPPDVQERAPQPPRDQRKVPRKSNKRLGRLRAIGNRPPLSTFEKAAQKERTRRLEYNVGRPRHDRLAVSIKKIRHRLRLAVKVKAKLREAGVE